MEEKSNSTAIALTLVLAMFLQVVFAMAGTSDSPSKAVIEFSEAYFRLDPSMEDRICEERKMVDDEDAVKKYLYLSAQEAKARGFGIDWLKKGLYHAQTTTFAQGENEAKVRITGALRTRMNPVFAWVAGIFRLGETEHLEDVIDVVREDGKWKVCGTLFALPGN